MIRLDRVELLHWDMQPHQVLPFARGVTLVTGENGSGKTAILDALKVALGAPRLGGERTVAGYLARQARPVAMVRLLVDNRPEPGTRRRPFDPLGEHSQDLVTLAVVFRAHDEEVYRAEYYLLDGDVVPLDEAGPAGRARGERPRPLPSGAAYRERLRRVGLGERYLKLLCLPQGQIASLCRKDGAQLFDDLYDIIGGRDALERWEDCVRQLHERQRESAAVEAELVLARADLGRLADRVRRHAQFRAKAERLATLGRARPHVRLAEVRAEAERLAREIERALRDVERLAAEREGHEGARAAATRARTALEAARAEVEAAQTRVAAERDARRDALATARARLAELERLRAAAEGVAPADVAALAERAEALRAELAGGQAVQAARADERRRLAAELAQVRAGLLPLPPEVERFRERLRGAGVPHHLLAEVLEVEDDGWREALEGYLGRYRFAVVVHEAEAWSRAAELAREDGYPHGVLAPDVRGTSPVDEDSLLALLRVKEARYRPLVARLLRRVRPGEPPSPLAPERQLVRLARDGFLVSRIEARCARPEALFLGREALRRRETALQSALAEVDAATAGWRAEETRLRAAVAAAEAAIAAQRRRLAWEAVRDEHGHRRTQAAELEEGLRALEFERAELLARGRLLVDEALLRRDEEATARTRGEEAARELAARSAQREQRTAERARVDEELGSLLLAPLPPPDEAVRAELDLGLSLRAVDRMAQELERDVAGFTADERDPLLPQNHARQAAEAEAVERRLEVLRAQLDATRAAAEEARDQYQRTTRLVFRGYFARLREAGGALDFGIEGRLEPRENGRFSCDIRVAVGDKAPVHHDSEDLSGGQKAALSILMAMTAVSLESEGAGFFLIDEPFAASDVHKTNELGRFLDRTGAQYLVSMPTSADLDQCGPWLRATWTCTRSRGGFDAAGRPVLAAPVKLGFAVGARDGG